jgi:hypothetical protein
LKIHYLGQKEGEHVGAGDPPSASEAVDIAKLSRMAARNKRVTFFISFSPRSLELILAGETLRVFEENGTHVRKACDFTRRKSASRPVIWAIRYLATTTLFSKKVVGKPTTPWKDAKFNGPSEWQAKCEVTEF